MVNIYKKWEELIPCPHVLGANNSRDRYYQRCAKHDKILKENGFISNPPPIIVLPSHCNYCELETSLRKHGQLKEVLLYNDGETIRGPDGNHRAITLGLIINKPIECVITDKSVPKTMLEWVTGISQDDKTKQTDFETIVNWIECLYEIEAVEKIADTVFAYRSNCAQNGKIDDVHFIYNKLIPVYRQRPELRGRIGRPGDYMYGSREKRADQRIFFCYGRIKEIINKNMEYELNEISTILKEPSLGTLTAFRKKDEQLIKILRNISKIRNTPPHDPLKINTLNELLIKYSPKKNPEPLMALDLFARKMDEQSTTGLLLSHGFDVFAIGDETNRFMTPSKNLTFVEKDIYSYLYQHAPYLDQYDWINVDPYGGISTKIICDLTNLTPNLTWFISQWKKRRSRKNYKITVRDHLEEFGLSPPKNFEHYLSLVKQILLENNLFVEQHELRKGNIMLYIKNEHIQKNNLQNNHHQVN